MVLAGLAATAAAQDLRADLSIGTVEGKKDEPPPIHATVYSPSAPPEAGKIKLIQENAKTGNIEFAASSVKKYVEGDEPVTIVVVFETQHLWIGNADWIMESDTPDEKNKSEGYHKHLVAALNELQTAGPSGSKAAFIAYGDSPKLVWSGALADATGKEIGTTKQLGSHQNAQGGLTTNFGQEVGAGLGEAVAAFKKLGGSRKVLILIGDGRNADQASDYKAQFNSERVEVYTMHLTTDPLGHEGIGDPSGWKKFADKYTGYTLGSGDDIGSKFKQVVAAISDRYYVTFPTFDLTAKKSFDWDGKTHSFILKVEKLEAELDPSELQLVPEWKPPWMRSKGGWPWYYWLGIILGPLLLIVILVAVLKKKPQPEPEPVVVAPAPVVAPPPAAPALPAAPQRTMAINLNADGDGWPIVGWLVPLNGANQFQTFKLSHGITKIGTGGSSQIIINDGYMSTEHCYIQISPTGFTLVDSSTNGTFVNEKKIDKHELWDNDTVMMGKTNFRFKSTL